MTDDDPIAPTWCALRRSYGSGATLRLLADRATPWWSATFAGHRLALTLAAPPGPALDRWLEGLSEAELPIPGRLVADCLVERAVEVDGEVRIDLALLVLDDG